MSKIEHSSPTAEWDFKADMAELGMGRDKNLYRAKMKSAIRQSRTSNKHFYLMLNANDPHKLIHFYYDIDEWELYD